LFYLHRIFRLRGLSEIQQTLMLNDWLSNPLKFSKI
jgi:hypothetical protein